MSENPNTDPGSPSAGSIAQVWRARAINTFGVLVVVGIVLALVAPAIRFPSRGSTRAQCINNLKQIGIALLSYESKHGTFPPAYTVDANGKRLHSWRALILPFMEQKALYESIDFSKPWDDPVNRTAFERDLRCYQCPAADCPECHTNYFVVVGPDGMFNGAESRKFGDVTDKQETVLLAIEAEATRRVHWMSPDDLDPTWFGKLTEVKELPHDDRVNVVMLDGRAFSLAADVPPEQLQAILSIAGGDDAVALRVE
jgi:prepilin-type processing-associated H-X9-DG protein